MSDTVKVWDLPTRLVHWTLAAAFAAAWWTAESGKMEWHRWSGYLILGLVVFRLYWGFAGPESARFGSFVKGPVAVARYASGLFRKGGEPALGHNAMGGWSVLALLAFTGAIVGFGLFAGDVDGFESGPLSWMVDFDATRTASEWHDRLFHIALWLVGLHVAAIVFYLLVKRENLVGAMLTGRKPRPPGAGDLKFAGPVRLLIGVALAAAAVWFTMKGWRL